MHGCGNENGICSLINTNKPILLIKSASCSSVGSAHRSFCTSGSAWGVPKEGPRGSSGTHPGVMDDLMGSSTTQHEQKPLNPRPSAQEEQKALSLLALPLPEHRRQIQHFHQVPVGERENQRLCPPSQAQVEGLQTADDRKGQKHEKILKLPSQIPSQRKTCPDSRMLQALPWISRDWWPALISQCCGFQGVTGDFSVTL